MKRRKWTSEKKVRFILEVFRGRPIGEQCNELGISHAQYYQLHERFTRTLKEKRV
jgi:hypothetical protein